MRLGLLPCRPSRRLHICGSIIVVLLRYGGGVAPAPTVLGKAPNVNHPLVVVLNHHSACRARPTPLHRICLFSQIRAFLRPIPASPHRPTRELNPRQSKRTPNQVRHPPEILHGGRFKPQYKNTVCTCACVLETERAPDNRACTIHAMLRHCMQAYVRARHAICVVKNFPATIASERIDTTDRALLRFIVAFLAIANPKLGQMTWQTTFVQAFCKYVMYGTYRAASRGRTKFTMKPVRQHIITASYDGLSPYSGTHDPRFAPLLPNSCGHYAWIVACRRDSAQKLLLSRFLVYNCAAQSSNVCRPSHCRLAWDGLWTLGHVFW